MSGPKQFSPDEAKRIGDSLRLDWDQVDLEQFRMGSPVTVSSEEQRQSPVVRFKKLALSSASKDVYEHRERMKKWRIT